MTLPTDGIPLKKTHLSVRSSSTAFTTNQGAGSRSVITVTSSSGTSISHGKETFTPGATSSRSGASICISLSEVTVNGTPEAPTS